MGWTDDLVGGGFSDNTVGEGLIHNNDHWKWEKHVTTLKEMVDPYWIGYKYYGPKMRTTQWSWYQMLFKNDNGEWTKWNDTPWAEDGKALNEGSLSLDTTQDYSQNRGGRAYGTMNGVMSRQGMKDWDAMESALKTRKFGSTDDLAFTPEYDWSNRGELLGEWDEEYDNLDDMGQFPEFYVDENGDSWSMSHMGTEKLKELLVKIKDGSPNEKYAASRIIATQLMEQLGNPESHKEYYQSPDDPDITGTEAWDESYEAIIAELMNNNGNNAFTRQDSIDRLSLTDVDKQTVDDALRDRNILINDFEGDIRDAEKGIDDFYQDIQTDQAALTAKINRDVGGARLEEREDFASAGQTLSQEGREFLEQYGQVSTEKQGVEGAQEGISDIYDKIGGRATPGPDGIWGTPDDIKASGLHEDIGSEGFWFDPASGGQFTDYSETGEYIGDAPGFTGTAQDAGYEWMDATGLHQNIDIAKSEFLQTGQEWFQSDDFTGKFDMFWQDLKDAAFGGG